MFRGKVGFREFGNIFQNYFELEGPFLDLGTIAV